jgi:ankyrin repeat protein
MPKSSVGDYWTWEDLRQSIRASRTGVVGSQLILALAETGLLLPMRLLLEKGSNADVNTTKGHTALMIAMNYKQYDIVRLLLEKGANPKLKDNYNNLALNYLQIDCPPELKVSLQQSSFQ